MASLSNSSGGTVKATFNPVDAYFNNPVGGAGFPATNANTYSVVGGNTSIIGKQVLANVCIGVQGVGNVFASTGSNIVVGLGTDFANMATGTHLYAQWGGNVQVAQLLGTTTSTKGNLLVGLANTNATGNLINVDPGSNAQSLTAGTPVVFDVSAGGLVAGATYFVKTIANAVSFTVSNAPGGAVRAVTTNASVSGNAIQNRVVLGAVSANNASGTNGYGDGFAQALPEAGYIVRQKGKQKYLVTGTVTGLTAQCYTAKLANTALTPNTMHIIATDDASVGYSVQTLSDHTVGLFNTDSGPVATDNIVLPGQPTGTAGYINTSPAFSTFNTAYAANTYGGQPYPIVQIGNA